MEWLGTFADGAWSDARSRLAPCLDDPDAAGEALAALAVVAHLTGDDTTSDVAFERAHRALLDDDPRAAARCAFWFGLLLHQRGEHARAGGWLGRAARAVAEDPDAPEHGYLHVPVGLRALADGDGEAALAAFTTAAEVADRSRDTDLQALGRLGTGQALVLLGRVPAGLALLDEAMVGVQAGEVSPIPAGLIHCAVIETCQSVHDLDRAREWTAALTAWCEAQPDLVAFRGQCLIHRTELLQLQGAWDAALREAARARARFADRPGTTAIGDAWYQEGELHRLQGHLEAAEEAYGEAARAGAPVQPGLARLRAVQGRHEAAVAALRRTLAEPGGPARRVHLLSALVEVLLSADDVAGAREVVDDLSATAAAIGAPVLQAMAAHVRGAVQLVEGDPAGALPTLRSAWSTWSELQVPYEAARVRVLIGLTCRRLGDEDGARFELDAARRVFIELGAEVDLARMPAVVADAPTASSPPGGLTGREVEVLGLVARGHTNRAIADTLVISEHTVARHVQNILTKLGVGSRTAAAAFAFDHGLVPPDHGGS